MKDVAQLEQPKDNAEHIKKIGILLAGSSGSKFWPVSNSKAPEQFVYLFDNTTLFQKTFDLINKQIDADSIFVVVDERFKHFVLEQIPIKEDNVITEPLMRQTAPALCLALTLLEDKMADDTLICVFPTDQMIKNHGEFDIALTTAFEGASSLDGLITIGIEPTSPASYFGYIQYSEEEETYSKADTVMESLFNKGIRKSINFVEKPDDETAQRFLDSGDFFWNSGILIAKKNVILNAYKKFMSYYYEKFQHLKTLRQDQKFENDTYNTELASLYKTFNIISIDYGILENADNVYVVKSTFSWYDLNNWSELHKITHKDALNNVFSGNIISLNTHNSVVMSNDKPIAIMGLDDIVAINTDTAILICKKSESYKVKELVTQLKKYNIPIY